MPQKKVHLWRRCRENTWEGFISSCWRNTRLYHHDIWDDVGLLVVWKRQNCIITPCPGFNFLCLLHNVTLINSETDKKYFDLNCWCTTPHRSTEKSNQLCRCTWEIACFSEKPLGSSTKYRNGYISFKDTKTLRVRVTWKLPWFKHRPSLLGVTWMSMWYVVIKK